MNRIAFRSMLVAAVCAFALSACGGSGSFSCSDHSKCANDPATTQSQIDSCNAALAGACGSQYKDVGACAESSQKCGSDGKTDSSNLASSCSVQLAALFNCCNSHSTAPGCS